MSDKNVAVLPTLADLVTDPDKARGLSRQQLGARLIELSALQARLGVEMLQAPEPAQVPPVDDVLTIEQAAARLQLAPATMQKWLRREPYNRAVVVHSRNCVRVSSALLEQVIHDGAVRLSPRPRGRA